MVDAGGDEQASPARKPTIGSRKSSAATNRPALKRAQTMRPADFAAAKAAAVAAALQAVKGLDFDEKENENDDVPFATPGLSAATAMIRFGVASLEDEDDSDSALSPRSKFARFGDFSGQRKRAQSTAGSITEGYELAGSGEDDDGASRGPMTMTSTRRQKSFSSMYHMLQGSGGSNALGGGGDAPPTHKRMSSRDLHVLINNGDGNGVPDVKPTHENGEPARTEVQTNGEKQGDNKAGNTSPDPSAPLVPAAAVYKDPFSLGPRPRVPEAHGRFQLWGLGILWFFAIILQTCAVWSNDWIEYVDTQLYHQGKDLIQWLTCSFAVGLGLFGYTCLMFRMHGLVFATNKYKWTAIACLIGQGVLSATATTLYQQDHSDLVDNSNGFLQWGSAYNFCILSRSYIGCCIVLVLWQEAVEWRSRYRARRLDRALAALRVLKEKALKDTQDAGEGALGAEATAMKKHSQEVEKTIHDLGLSAASSARLLAAHKADQLPTAAALQTLLFTLYNDKDYLSRGQRRLVWVSNVFFIIIFFGGLFYAELEGWNARAAVDFAIVTLTTIGYGNMAPRTDIGRIFLYIYFPVNRNARGTFTQQLHTHHAHSSPCFCVLSLSPDRFRRGRLHDPNLVEGRALQIGPSLLLPLRMGVQEAPGA